MIKDFDRQNTNLRLRSVQILSYEVNSFEPIPRQKIPRSDIHPKTFVCTTILFGQNIDQSKTIESPYAYGGSLQPGPINNRLLKA